MKNASRFLVALLLFLVTLVIYVGSEVTSRTDTVWSLYIASSIVREGDTDLDEFAHLVAADDYRVQRIGGHLRSFFPVGTPLVAAPFVYVYDQFLVLIGRPAFSSYLAGHAPDETVFSVEKVVASLITAASAVVIFATALRFTSLPRALVVALIYSLGTGAWSTASRGLWQHGPSMLAVSLAIYLLVLSRDRPHLAHYAAIPLGLACVIRPTNIIPLVVFGLYILVTARVQFVKYVLWLLLIFIPFFLYNLSVYGAVVQTYFNPARLSGSPSVLNALIGHLVSPSRGLFIFSPVLLASIIGMALAMKQPNLKSIEVYAALAILLHWIAVSLTAKWYGGWSIGPRFFAEILPVLVFFLVPVVDRLPGMRQIGHPMTLSFGILLVLSILIQFLSASRWESFAWNHTPNNIDKNTQRLWDWSDIQFLRGLCAEPDFQAPKCWLEGGLREIAGILPLPGESGAAGGPGTLTPAD